MPSHTKRPFPVTPEPSQPWAGVKAPDKMRDGSSPNSTVGVQSNFADGGLIGGVVTPMPSPGSAQHTQSFADGGKVGKGSARGKKRRRVDPDDLGTGLASEAATQLTGRELQIENQIRAAEGLPPLKSK